MQTPENVKVILPTVFFLKNNKLFPDSERNKKFFKNC